MTYREREDKRHAEKRQVLVTLTRPEITFDVDFETANVARNSMGGLKAEEKKELVKAVTGEETKDWLDRQIDSAWNRLVNMAGGHFDRPHSHARRDWIDWEQQTWTIALLMEPEWRGDSGALTSAAHDYVVAYVLSQWYGMVDTKRVGQYEDRAHKCLRQWKDELAKYKVGTQYW